MPKDGLPADPSWSISPATSWLVLASSHDGAYRQKDPFNILKHWFNRGMTAA